MSDGACAAVTSHDPSEKLLVCVCPADSATGQPVSAAGEGGAGDGANGVLCEGHGEEHLPAPLQRPSADVTAQRVSSPVGLPFPEVGCRCRGVFFRS